MTGSAGATAHAPAFTGPGEVTIREGYLGVEWENPGAARSEPFEHELQQSASASFADAKVRYRGAAHRYFVSGLAEGSYFMRVRSRRTDDPRWSPWSEPLVVVVRHHSLSLALTLFAIGGIVFSATAAFVFRGARVARERNDAQ